MSKIHIRPIARTDIEIVFNLLNEGISFVPIDRDRLSEYWEVFSSQANIKGFVGCLDNQVICYCSIVLERKVRGGLAAHLEDVVCDKNFRNMGVGSIFISEVLSKCKSLGVYKISLQGRRENESFYNRLGFSSRGVSLVKFT